jgi:hypothetical protein
MCQENKTEKLSGFKLPQQTFYDVELWKMHYSIEEEAKLSRVKNII